MMTPFAADLRKDALAIRKTFLGMHYRAKSGHIGTGLSCIFSHITSVINPPTIATHS